MIRLFTDDLRRLEMLVHSQLNDTAAFPGRRSIEAMPLCYVCPPGSSLLAGASGLNFFRAARHRFSGGWAEPRSPSRNGISPRF
jgi:hypothetical protein